MYYPLVEELSPDVVGLAEMQKITLNTADNVEITAWQYQPSNNSQPTILYLHGNADNISHEYRTKRFRAFIDAGYGVLAVSWRGYGDSEGSPSEEGLYADARSAINHLTENSKTELNKIILFGESLGSGVAVQMATEYAVLGLLLDSPYTSTVNRAAEIYPWLPVGLLMNDKYESHKKIKNIHPMKMVIFHGEKDAVIPIHHGRQLFGLANEPKIGKFYDGLGHVDVSASEIVEVLRAEF